MSNAQYAIAGIGVAGMMSAGYCQQQLLIQVGKYYTPAVAGMGVAGLMAADCTTQGTALRVIEREGFSVEDAGIGAPPTAAFTIICQTNAAPQDGDPVVVAINTLQTRLFGGYVVDHEMTRYTPSRVAYHCTAQSWARDLQKRLICGAWSDRYTGQIVCEILATYAPHISTSRVEDGVFVSAHTVNYVTALAACQALAAQSGYVFAVDADRVAHFHPADALPAPWDITSGTAFGNLKITQDSSGIVNRVIVLFSDLRPQTAAFVGDSVTEDFTLSYTPYAINTLTVNGVAVTYGTHYAEDNSEKDFSIDYERGIINTRKHSILTPSQMLAISYTAKFPARLTRSHSESIAARREREGGDGIYDLLVDDRDGILSLEDARTRADAELERNAWPRVAVTYDRGDNLLDLMENRVRSGMLQRIAYWGIDEALNVEKVTLTALNNINDYRLHFQQSVALGRQAATLTDAIADTTAAVDATAAVTYEETR